MRLWKKENAWIYRPIVFAIFVGIYFMLSIVLFEVYRDKNKIEGVYKDGVLEYRDHGPDRAPDYFKLVPVDKPLDWDEEE